MQETLLFTYFLFPILIILARIADVSLGTLRIILVSKGLQALAPMIGFFEVLIWILVAKQIITDVPNDLSLASILAYGSYALGYALGTYVGISLDKRLSLGKVLVRVILSKSDTMLDMALRESKFGVTTVDAKGKNGPVKILFIVINRTELEKAIEMIQEKNPGAFFTIENVQTVNAGYFSEYSDSGSISRLSRMFLPGRNSK